MSEKKKYALFLGCTVPVRALNYELSARKIAEILGIEIVDLPEFSCCGYPISSVHHHTAISLAARNLAIAEKAGVDIVTLCSSCTGFQVKAQKALSGPEGAEELKKVNEDLKEIGYEYKGSVKVKHIVRVLMEDVGIEKIKEAIVKPLTGINVAAHYGCHITKPSDIFEGFDDPIHPESLDKLIEATGATSVQYKNKHQCCGGGVLGTNEDIPIKMVREKLENVKNANADAIALVCPFCSVMYDEMQPTVDSKFDMESNIPVLYYTQLLGLALGLDPKKDLAVKKNRVKVKPLLQKLEELQNGSE
jgi:heterodisulfide reductase subunit B2